MIQHDATTPLGFYCRSMLERLCDRCSLYRVHVTLELLLEVGVAIKAVSGKHLAEAPIVALGQTAPPGEGALRRGSGGPSGQLAGGFVRAPNGRSPVAFSRPQ